MLEVKIVVQSLHKTGVYAFVLDTVFVKIKCVGEVLICRKIIHCINTVVKIGDQH
jgi:hypothetical protein